MPRLYCDECARLSKKRNPYNDAACKLRHAIRFKAPRSYQSIQTHNWGWVPKEGECEDFLSARDAER